MSISSWLFPLEREQVETVQGERQRESGVYIQVHEHFELAFNAEMASPAYAHVEKVVGRVGFEPTTSRLKAECSTTELTPHRYSA